MTFERGQRVYSSTGSKSHIVGTVTPRGNTITLCGRDATHDYYPDRLRSLPLCKQCERFDR